MAVTQLESPPIGDAHTVRGVGAIPGCFLTQQILAFACA
jgi:hypothetical protein